MERQELKTNEEHDAVAEKKSTATTLAPPPNWTPPTGPLYAIGEPSIFGSELFTLQRSISLSIAA